MIWRRARRLAPNRRLARAQPPSSRGLPRRGGGCVKERGKHQRLHGGRRRSLQRRESGHHRLMKPQRPAQRHGRSQRRRTQREPRRKAQNRRHRQRLHRRIPVLPRRSSARNGCAIMWPRLSWPDSIRTLAPKRSFLPIASSTTTAASWIVKRFAKN